MEPNQNFRDLLQSLSDAGVRFLVVGAYAVMYHTEPRYTKDLDVWVEPTPENVSRLWRALTEFGAPLAAVSQSDFLNPEIIYQMGVEPNRIDVLMGLEGITFETAWRNRARTTYGNVPVYVLGRKDLIRNKRTAGRPMDLLDVKALLDAGRFRRKKQRKSKKRKRE
jgi:hypothetical protein